MQPATIKPATGTASLFLAINQQEKGKTKTTTYIVRRLEPHPEIGGPAWRLVKTTANGVRSDAYDVILTPHGITCSCPSFIYVRDGQDERGCKHCLALQAVGLI